MDYKRIESELRCIVCRDLYKYPIMLPCGCSVCATCTDKCLSSAVSSTPSPPHNRRLSQDIPDLVGGSEKELHGGNALESDQISMVASEISDTDSGVVCSSTGSGVNNKRDSFLSAGSERGLFQLTCPSPRCHKVFLTDDTPGKTFPPNRLMMKILSKYTSSLLSSPASTPTSGMGMPPFCQLCETQPIRLAVLFCQQCEILYCQQCRDSFHPQRGPLATHKFISAESKDICSPQMQQQQLHNNYVCAALEQQKCPLHNHEYTMYCTPCRLPLCWRCVEKDTFHQEQHDVQSLLGLSKAKKAEFSRALQLLSEKSKRMTEWISRVKTASSKIPDAGSELETSIISQFDQLIRLVNEQKNHLLHNLQIAKTQKQTECKEHAADCTNSLQQATAQIQFGIEVLKETEAVNFLQFSAPLLNKVNETSQLLDQNFAHDWKPELNLRFDSRSLTQVLQKLDLQQVSIPATPRLSIEDCRIINGQISLSWNSADPQNTDLYVLEVAESGAQFSRAYCGPENTCSLSFNSQTMIYQARLKATNIAGESAYSNVVTLHVEGGYFTWEAALPSRDLITGNEGLTLTSNSPEDFVVLAGAGFVRGVHYWEVHVDRYDNHPDPAFGIATAGVKRDAMLGKDANGWSVYIDAARSWCLHNNQHVNRMDGGITAGCTVGILLDLDQRHLSFFVNDEPQVPIPAFQNLPEGLVYYPAVSINRNVQVTLRPCLDTPSAVWSPPPV